MRHPAEDRRQAGHPRVALETIVPGTAAKRVVSRATGQTFASPPTGYHVITAPPIDAGLTENGVERKRVERNRVRAGLSSDAESDVVPTPGKGRRVRKIAELKEVDHSAAADEFIRLTGSGARHLIGRCVRVVGIDFLSIGDEDAHRAQVPSLDKQLKPDVARYAAFS
ncbi:MAG: hypothetical protein M3327_12980 [Actinomycetota bacterium]|nr:hypothetical protein [Actinomycetota bacterium]